jgi:hypothetical protein
MNHIHPHKTDLFTRARANLALPPEKRVPRFTKLLQGKLLPPARPVEGVKPNDPPPATKYYVLLVLGTDTPDANKILLDVARFYGPLRATHPEVEVVTLALDKATAERKVPWRTIDPKHADSLFWFRNFDKPAPRFPTVIIFDANGAYRESPTSPDIKAMLDDFAKSLDQAK